VDHPLVDTAVDNLFLKLDRLESVVQPLRRSHSLAEEAVRDGEDVGLVHNGELGVGREEGNLVGDLADPLRGDLGDSPSGLCDFVAVRVGRHALLLDVLCGQS
jgi:hypothetical protein